MLSPFARRRLVLLRFAEGLPMTDNQYPSGLKRLLHTPQGSPDSPRPFFQDNVVRVFLAAMALCFFSTWIVALTGAALGIPALEQVGVDLFVWGALDARFWHGEWWRVISSMFLHAGFGHLIGNTLFMVPLMMLMRRWTKGLSWLAVFVLAGVAGGLLELAVHPDVRLVGASGGIAGLWGAAMVVAWRLVKRGKQALFALVVMFVLGYLLFQQVQGAIASADGNIAHLAHLGGILAGALIGTRLPLRFNYDSGSSGSGS